MNALSTYELELLRDAVDRRREGLLNRPGARKEAITDLGALREKISRELDARHAAGGGVL